MISPKIPDFVCDAINETDKPKPKLIYSPFPTDLTSSTSKKAINSSLIKFIFISFHRAPGLSQIGPLRRGV